MANNTDLIFTREKIPANSEAIRIIDSEGRVKFVCIESPMERKSERFYWLAYGMLNFKIRRLIQQELSQIGVTSLSFKRLKKGRLVDRQITKTEPLLKAPLGSVAPLTHMLFKMSLVLNTVLLVWVLLGELLNVPL